MQLAKYTRLWADDSGESHFEEVEAELEPVDFAPPAPPLNFTPLGSARTVGLVGGGPEWRGDIAHPAPRRQLMCVMTGEFTGTASDGESRVFGPGDLLLLEDTTGKGHSTRITSSEPGLILVVTLD